MLSLDIPSQVVDFIEGRTPDSILSRHYLDLLTLAKNTIQSMLIGLRQLCNLSFYLSILS
ncbi:integrase [Sulfuracidifex metallicus]|uniref:integrase n=1 Tax=Sulfuracidifex metallicus TaxID=47303 RepID=UPI000AC54D28|nr:integrase [Sulfuracidifex metallicus]